MAYTRNPRPINRCQYWIEKEPIQCVYWDKDRTVCIFEKEVKTKYNNIETVFTQRGDLYPFCNYIGTAKFTCTKYAVVLPPEDGEEPADPPEEVIAPRCVLPDPSRYKSMSPNCGNWVVPKIFTPTKTGGPPKELEPMDYSGITGYNDGACNFKKGDDKTGGTDVACEGFTPHHLGFGTVPFQDLCTISGVTASGTISKVAGFPSGPNKPMNYDVLNLRALLGRCRWWDSDDYLFVLEQDADGKLTIVPPAFKCTNTSPLVTPFANFFNDKENLYTRPPCNGAMPDCPKYTGNLASSGFMPYLSSIYLRSGDKVLAEQILEIRYNIRKETWDIEDYKTYFGLEAILYANEGSKPNIVYKGTVIKDYSLKAIKTEINNFLCFSIKKTQVLLTKGTTADSLLPKFPTLIKELKNILLEPIIRSIFDTQYNYTKTNIVKRSNKECIFETALSDHEELLIVGEYFGNNSNLFAINIDDPSMDFPFNNLIKCKNMYEYKELFGKVIEDKNLAQSQFEVAHRNLACYFKLLREISSDKMYFNEWSTSCAAFSIGVKTFFGVNRIFVFDISTDIYTFAAITVRKIFCGGLVSQTAFEVSTEQKEMSSLFDFEMQTCFPAFSPKIKYEFNPFRSSDNQTGALPYHTYLDTRVIVPPGGTSTFSDVSTYLLGYKLYRIQVMTPFVIDSSCDDEKYGRLVFLGNEGHVLVYIKDKFKLHSVIRNWDSGEVNENGDPIAMTFFLKGKNCNEEDVSIEMVILEQSSKRLEVNQIILKPKNTNTYVRLYDPFIEFNNGLYIYERWSFERTPSENHEEIRDNYPDKDVNVIVAAAALEGSLSSGDYTITSLPTTPIVAAIMFKGANSGRIKGQVKSDLLVWVKKPFCSDVEIMYTWQANYQETLLLPNGYCFVSDIDTRKIKTYVGGSSPRCGDHQFGRYTTRPNPMWYPYNACDRYAVYGLASGNYENDNSAPMEFWTNSVGKPDFANTTHGSDDLRMLGPSKHYGYTADAHARIWACSCDYTFHNSDMISTPWFAGWARIRGGIEGEAYYYLVQNGGTPPKFGNKHRPYLLSYRSNAAMHYQLVNDSGGISIQKKWMPSYEAFSDLGLREVFKESLWKNYFNESDNFSLYYSQLGLLKASSTVNKIPVNEKLVRETSDDTNTKLKRYSFDEVFIPHFLYNALAYPEPRKVYYRGKDNPKPITAWLTYKDYSDVSEKSTFSRDFGGGGASGDWDVPSPGSSPIDFQESAGKAIQWAWREQWSPLERELLNIRDILRDLPLDTCNTVVVHSNYLSFLNIYYLNYTYDFRLKEYRRIPLEGLIKISWEPSVYEKEYDENSSKNKPPVHFLVRLNNGPARVLNTKLEVITEASDLEEGIEFKSLSRSETVSHIEFYKICSSSFWINSATSVTDLETMSLATKATSGFILYDPETEVVSSEDTAKEKADLAERKVAYYEDGEEKYLYFNRGLYVNINDAMTKYIPKKLEIIGLPYEINLSRPSNDDTDYSIIDTNLFYPAIESFGIKYIFQAETVTIIFKFDNPVNVGQLDIVYFKGLEREEVTIDEKVFDFINYYHIPEVTLSRSTDGVTFTEVQNFPFESADTTTEKEFSVKYYNITNIDQQYMSEPSTHFSVTFNFSEDKVTFTNEPAKFFHFIYIETIKLHSIHYTEQEEYVQIHERKYHISVGSYGTYPIHGFEDQGSLLYPSTSELSTLYQYDTSYGMAGMSDSAGDFTSGGKTRDRIARPIQVDMTPLEGSYLDFEAKQKELYDDIALSGSDTITFTSVTSEIFKETMSSIGVTTFPEWTCEFKNNLMIPLMPVKEKELYYPEGHNWTWDTKSFKDVFNCGGGGLRRTVTTFAYKWGRVSGIYGYVHERDIFDLYSYGLSDVLTRMANPAETIAERLNNS